MPEIDQLQEEIFEYAKKENPEFLKTLRQRRKMDEEIESNLNIIIDAYVSDLESKRVKVEKKEEHFAMA